MNPKNFNNSSRKLNILFVPLDWGLGHITRCISLLNEFRSQNCTIYIAGEDTAKALLYDDFQEVTFIYKRGYRVRYSTNPSFFGLKILSQVPRIVSAIYFEHRWLKKVVKKYSINAIISDNRFGLYHSTIPSIYITHQLRIKTGSIFLEKIIQKIHHRFIRRFTSCWVPDFEGTDNIAGQLSHTVPVPPNVVYIGCLSRFVKQPQQKILYDLLIILSGPEPQRTIFEDILLSQVKNYPGRVLFVRGLPGIMQGNSGMNVEKGSALKIIIKAYLSSDELNNAIQQSEMVISRSGYTTIMDLIKLGQKAILVPTPGQTEQEYLAKHLMKQNFFYTESQENFVLKQALIKAKKFPYALPLFDMDQYKTVVSQFVQSL